MLRLSDTPDKIPQVGPVVVRKLHSLGINSIRDLLFYFPFRYDEYLQDAQLGTLEEGSKVSIVGKLQSIENIFTRSKRKFTKALFYTNNSLVSVVWFNQPYLTKSLHAGEAYRLTGKVGNFGGVPTLVSPERIRASESEMSSTTPASSEIKKGEPIGVYSETAGLASRKIRDMITYVWKNVETFPEEYLPGSIMRNRELVSLKEAMRMMHFPRSLNEPEKARARFGYEEMYFSQLRSVMLRHRWQNNTLVFRLSIDAYKKEIDELIHSLPFVLTGGQQQAVQEILQNMAAPIPMNRLLEGDVGSGKTVVAAIAMYAAYLNGYKSLLMAPTQILATQHFLTVQRVLEPLGVGVTLVVSGNKKERAAGDIYIGTQALLHQKELLDKVALTIIDEQHRFGVEQRASLRSKHGMTHVLSMTATPIPRTLALTLYGDLDLSLINEMPAGRKPIKTRVVTGNKREEANEWIRKFIKETGEQVFIVCPFVEPSESSTSIKSAVSEYDRLRTKVFPDLTIGLLHGKLKSAEKDTILADFRVRKYQILVCTPVVEVGIDIPNASIIVIESAERFGLAQLHQFRGRVGRGGQQAFCLLFTSEEQQGDLRRLQALEETESGIDLAELDLQYRGSGNIFGFAQSGRSFFKYADLFNILSIQQAKEDAQETLKESPDLYLYPALKERISQDTEGIEAN